MDEVTKVFLEYSILGAVVVVMGVVIVTLYRQNQVLQKECRDTLREVIPAIAALDRVRDSVHRGGN